MTKSEKQNISLSIFFLFTFVTSIVFFQINKLNLERANEHNKKSFTKVMAMTGNIIYSGYMLWDEMYESFKLGDYKFIYENFDEIYTMSDYISIITIENSQEQFNNNPFIIKSQGADLFIIFKVFDSSGDNYIENTTVKVKINKEKILQDIQLKKDFSFSTNNQSIEFLYGLNVYSYTPPIYLYQILSCLGVGLIAGSLTFGFFYSHTNFFYETRGLEKIIFLFEQTEKYSANHSVHVEAITETLASKMGYRGRELKDIKIAALLHDIGKLSITREILNKNGKLTKEEFEIMKKHPVYSENIIKSFEELAHLAPFIKHHHEKMDGTGYPDGLKGEEIPIESRIIAVADIFEALTGDRPYRDPLPPNEAVEFMKSMSIDLKILFYLEFNLELICKKIDRPILA